VHNPFAGRIEHGEPEVAGPDLASIKAVSVGFAACAVAEEDAWVPAQADAAGVGGMMALPVASRPFENRFHDVSRRLMRSQLRSRIAGRHRPISKNYDRISRIDRIDRIDRMDRMIRMMLPRKGGPSRPDRHATALLFFLSAMELLHEESDGKQRVTKEAIGV
jgi:hypothetical protein